ncbi:MAG: PLP-dependent aminotransferase family protein, partial [Clostridiales bacterium]|nr:PLP-dependent aminotransferase family protein [Clostridiales bacterium]
MALNFAKRMEYMKASEIRELLKVTENTSMISFAGGTPAPELFPVQEIREVSRLVLKEEGAQSLQYSTTEGYAPLRCKIADRMNKGFKTNLTAENILITSGSQQGLDFSGKVFLNEGDAVLCEKPMYLAAIGAFRAYLPEFIEVESDAKGMIISDLERKLVENPHIKLAYVVPDFQNPTGTSWSLERRREFMKVISRYDVAVIEDNPYSELRFEGEAVP